MIVFRCDNCGDSVKKPKVEKHVTLKCLKKYAGVSLCCIDCLQDFEGNAYIEHTKCVSELGRYSAKGFVPQPRSNKGERKQNSWIDAVASVLNQTSLNKGQGDLLQVISSFENVPRKKVKFQNFIKSSIRNMKIQSKVVDSIFDLIEKEFNSSCAANSALSSSSNGTPEQKESLEQDTRLAALTKSAIIESLNLGIVQKDSALQEPPAFRSHWKIEDMHPAKEIENDVSNICEKRKMSTDKQTDDDVSELTDEPINKPISSKTKKQKLELQIADKNFKDKSSGNWENNISDDFKKKINRYRKETDKLMYFLVFEHRYVEGSYLTHLRVV